MSDPEKINRAAILGAAVRAAENLTPARSRVYMAMIIAAGPDCTVSVPLEMLAHITKLSSRTVRQHLNILEDTGFLDTEYTARYRITVPGGEHTDE